MFRLNRNERSHWSGNGVHVESELVFMIGRNMHTLTLSPKGRGDQTEKCRGFGRPQKNRSLGCNASQLSLTGIVFTRFSRRILLWFGFDAPWVTSFSAGG